MWMARKQVKTHARPLSVRYLISINYKSIFKQHSSKTNPNIFRKILIYWNTEAFLMSGGGLIHLVLMLPLIFKSFVHYSFGSKNNWVVFMTASLQWFSSVKRLFFFFSNSFIHLKCHSSSIEPGSFLLHHKLASCCVMIYCLRETNHNQICAWRWLQLLEAVVTMLLVLCKYYTHDLMF